MDRFRITMPTKLQEFIRKNNIGADLRTKFNVGNNSFEANNSIRTVTLPEHLGGGQFKTSGPETLINTPRATNQNLKTQQRSEIDHIIPVSLGGTSNDPNLQELKNNPSFLEKLQGKRFGELKTKNRQEGKILVELKAINDYKSGEISLAQARLRVLRWKDEIDKPETVDFLPKLNSPLGTAIGGVKKAFNFSKSLLKKVKDIVDKKKEDPFQFIVGEGLTAEEKKRAEELIKKPSEVKQIGDSISNFFARNDPFKPTQDTPPQIAKDIQVLKYASKKGETSPEAEKELERLVYNFGNDAINIIFGGTKNVIEQAPYISKNIINRLTKAIDSAKPVREATEQLYSAERARRAAQIEAIGGKVKGEAGFFAQLSKLKGELPKKQFEPIRNQFAQTEVDILFNTVQDANILPFEKITAKNALTKLFEGSIPTRSEINLMREIFPKNFIDTILKKRPRSEQLFDLIGNIVNVPRTIMASFDFSAPLRQGLFLIGRPKRFLPNFARMFKYAFSEKAYQGMLNTIKAKPVYKTMRQSKLALTEIDDPLLQKEEALMGNIVEQVPGIGHIVKISNRAYSGFLNKMRADVFEDLVTKSTKLGLRKDEKFLKDIAKYVNAATGRGNLPNVLERTAPILNATFFSPRLIASRVNLLNPYFYVTLNPFVRKEALRDLLILGSTATTVLGLAGLNDDVEVGTNPKSADFGKIKAGNTRYDIFGGFQQYIRLASQLITGEIVSSTTERTMTIGEGFGLPTTLDIAQRFFEHKTAPLPSFLIGMLKGETAVGEDFDIPTEISNRFISFVVQDLYDLAQEKGIENVWEGLPAIFGIGVQTYGRQELAEGKNKLGETTLQIRPVRSLAEKIRESILGQQALGSTKSFSIEAYFDQLNELPRDEAREVFNKIAEGNPELAKKINKIVQEREKGITPKDKDLKAKSVASGDRALEIEKQLKKIDDKEKKADLWAEYVRKGIITEEVARQLIILLNQ